MHGRLAFLGTVALCGVLAVTTSSSNLPKPASGRSDSKPITIQAGTAPPTTSAIQAPIPIAPGGTSRHVFRPLLPTTPGQVGNYIQGITQCLESGRVCDLS